MRSKRVEVRGREYALFWPEHNGSFAAWDERIIRECGHCFLPILTQESDGMAVVDVTGLCSVQEAGELNRIAAKDVLAAARELERRGVCVMYEAEFVFVDAVGRLFMIALPYGQRSVGSAEALNRELGLLWLEEEKREFLREITAQAEAADARVCEGESDGAEEALIRAGGSVRAEASADNVVVKETPVAADESMSAEPLSDVFAKLSAREPRADAGDGVEMAEAPAENVGAEELRADSGENAGAKDAPGENVSAKESPINAGENTGVAEALADMLAKLGGAEALADVLAKINMNVLPVDEKESIEPRKAAVEEDRKVRAEEAPADAAVEEASPIGADENIGVEKEPVENIGAEALADVLARISMNVPPVDAGGSTGVREVPEELFRKPDDNIKNSVPPISIPTPVTETDEEPKRESVFRFGRRAEEKKKEAKKKESGKKGGLFGKFSLDGFSDTDDSDEDEGAETQYETEKVLYLSRGKRRDRKAFKIPKDGVVRIGRTAAFADIIIANSSVSEKHATIRYDHGKYWLTDKNSTNGTMMDGNQLAPESDVAIQEASVISFGNVQFYAIFEEE